jgi:PAS domain S-box-containing protein
MFAVLGRCLSTVGGRLKWRSLQTRVTILTLAIFLTSIWLLAFYASRMLREDLERMLSDQQSSVVSIMAGQVNQEMELRLRSIEDIASRITPAMLDRPSSLQDYLTNRSVLHAMFNGGLFVTRADGRAIADHPASTGRVGMPYSDREWMRAALEGKTTVGKPIVGQALKVPVFCMAAPVRNARGQAIGALVGVVDLSKPNFLDLVTKNRYGESGGYVLVAPQYRLTVTATDKSRIMQPAPPPGINPLFDRYLLGFEGSGVVVDSRGQEVLSSARQIPAAGWLLIARIPTREAFAPVRHLMWNLFLVTLLLTLLAGVLTWSMLERQLAPTWTTIKALGALAQADHTPQPLPIARDDEIGELIGGFNRLLETRKQAEAALVDAAREWSTSFDAMPEGVSIHAPDRTILRVNRSLCRLLGKGEEEIVGRKCHAIFHGMEGPVSHCPVERTRQTGCKEQAEFYETGLERWLSVSSSPVFDDAGHLIRIVHVVSDVTERKRAEQQRATIAEIGRIISSSPDIDEVYERFADEARRLIPFDRLGVSLNDCSAGLVRITYVSRTALLGRPQGDTYPLAGSFIESVMREGTGLMVQFEDRRELAERYPSLLDSYDAGVRSTLSVPLLSRGKVIGCLTFRSKMSNAYTGRDLSLARQIGDQIAGAIANAQLLSDLNKDIGERKRAEKEMREIADRFSKAFTACPEAMTIASMEDGTYIEVNDVFLKKTGYHRSEAIGRTSTELGVWIDPEDRRRYIEQLFARRSLRDFETRFRMRDGQVRDFSVSSEIIELEGRPCSLNFIVDTTERKRAEQERLAMEKGLLQAQKVEAIGTLAGGIAHDFNNILAGIMGYIEMALDESPNDTQRHYLKETLKGAERAKDLVRQILTFSRQESHEKKPLDLKTLLRESVKFLRASIPATIEIQQQVADAPCNVMADATQMHQVIMNLCANATHAMRQAPGFLRIELTNTELAVGENYLHPELKPGPYVRLKVSDTGHGIDPAHIKRIFDPFFTTKNRDEGSGLGLSVVYGIVKSHEGDIQVSSEPGRGTSFEVLLPRIIPGVDAAQVAAPVPNPGGTERILFVDDEQDIVAITGRMLSSLGYRVTGLSSSTEALDRFRAAPDGFDLVITDMTLPKMTGIDLSREILTLRGDMPIILCSGIQDPQTEEQVQRLGIRAYCMKPLRRAEIARVIRETLDAPGGVKST